MYNEVSISSTYWAVRVEAPSELRTILWAQAGKLSPSLPVYLCCTMIKGEVNVRELSYAYGRASEPVIVTAGLWYPLLVFPHYSKLR